MLCGSMLYLPFQTQKERPDPFAVQREIEHSFHTDSAIWRVSTSASPGTLNKLPMKVLIFHSHSAMAKDNGTSEENGYKT